MHSLKATSLSISGPSVSPLRRSRTVKAPRKRTQLLVLSKRGSSEYSAGLGFGDNGNGSNGNGRGDFGRCWRFGGDDGGDGRGSNLSVSTGVAVLLAAAGAVTAIQAGPVGAFEAPASEDFGLLDIFTEDGAAAADLTPGFITVHEAYDPSAFDEEEKELVCPKQYRVREWVYVH